MATLRDPVAIHSGPVIRLRRLLLIADGRGEGSAAAGGVGSDSNRECIICARHCRMAQSRTVEARKNKTEGQFSRAQCASVSFAHCIAMPRRKLPP